MKFYYYILILVLLFLCYILSFLFDHILYNYYISIIISISIIAGFIVSYLIGIIVTVSNKDVVVRLKNKSPYVIPVIFFIIISLLQLIYCKNDLKLIFHLLSLIIIGIGLYFSGIWLVLFDLKRGIKKKYVRNVNEDYKYKLVLINPVSEKMKHYTKSAIIPPMGLGIIAALTPDDFEITLIDENFEIFEYVEADLVGITGFTSAANRAYEIARIYREKGVPVIMGGVHATVCADEVEGYVDSVVTGEAEYIWQEVIDDFVNFGDSGLKKRYTGTPVEPDDFVVPRRDLYDERYLFDTVQTSRGCPLNCSFCSVSVINGRKYRQKSVDLIIKDLKSVSQDHIFFVDDNLLGYGDDSEKRAIVLFKKMVELKLKKKWLCQSSLNFANNKDVLYWAKKSGCNSVFLGLESPDKEELKSMNKGLNTNYNYDIALKRINDYGISVLGAFIYGSDNETIESMYAKTDFIINSRVDITEVKIYTPLPSTELYKKMLKEKRLLYTDFPNDWDKYDLTKVTFKMKNITNDDFEHHMRICKEKILSKKTLFKKFIRTLINTKSIKVAVWSLYSNFAFVITRQLLDKDQIKK